MPQKKKTDPEQYSGFVLTFEPERTRWFLERLHSDTSFTDSFSALDWKLERKELTFLYLGSEEEPLSIRAFALMERMNGSGGTGKLKMCMSDMVVFDNSVSESGIPGITLKDIVCTPERLRRTDVAVWEALIDNICRTRPNQANEIKRLISLRETSPLIVGDSNRVDRLNEQRDALGLALDIAGLDRSSVLKSINIAHIEEADSIVDLIKKLSVDERSLIEHDERIFNMLLGEQSTQSTVFSNTGGDRTVWLHVTDKTPIETATGTDLLIYDRCHNSFLLLQYKKMEHKNNGWECDISRSKNIHDQLAQMEKFHRAASSGDATQPTSTLWSYRLNDNPFYFKFCEQVRPNARDDSLIPGITMSEHHLREFLALPEAQAGKDSQRVGYNNCPRYLSNTEFVNLAKGGWIGSRWQSTTLMKEILQAYDESGRTAMFAIIDTPKETSASGRGRKNK